MKGASTASIRSLKSSSNYLPRLRFSALFDQRPGRVVTLIAAQDWSSFSSTDEFPHEDIVWGVCYTISPEHAAEMREYLGAIAVCAVSGLIWAFSEYADNDVNPATKIIARRTGTQFTK